MLLYLILFFIPVAAYLVGGPVNRKKPFLACYMLLLALFVGLSDMFGGYDRYIYGEYFDGIADGVTYGFGFNQIGILSFYEPGYAALNYAVALFSENRYILIFTVTAIIYFCVYKAFERHITNYPFACIIFLGMMFFFTFTYLRQVLAFSVAWLSVKYLVDGKKWKFLAMVALVALMHKSGIVFACLLFMPMKKWKPSQVLLILGACLVVGLSGITSSLYDAFTASTELESANNYSAEGSARIAYVLEVAFFVWLILHNYNRIAVNRQNLLFLNMAWAFCAFLLLFVRSSDGGRVAWFFTLGIIYTVTLISASVDPKRLVARKTGVAALVMAVMLMLYVRVFVAWQHYNNLYPYKTFLSDGHRYPDYSWERYEYDHGYDDDKFYRPAFRFLK